MRRGAAMTAAIAGRNLMLVRRMPSVFIPSMVMPLFILIATAGAFAGVSALPALDGVSYLAFTVPMAALMGGAFAGTNSGITLARDIETGFVDRLIASPAPRLSIIAGPLVAALARSVFTTTLILTAGAIGGSTPPSVLAAAVLYLMAAFFCVAGGCWAIGVALRAGTVQAAPLMTVVIFISIFSSVMYAPREAMDGWLRAIADRNPVTYLLEAARDAHLDNVTWDGFWPGVVAGALLIVVLGAWAMTGLRRLAR